MSHDSESPATERRTDLRHRSRLTWVVAGAAVVVIVGGSAVAVLGTDGPEGSSPSVVDSRGVDGEDGGDPGDPGDSGAGTPPSVTELGIAPGEVAGRCLTPEAGPEVVAAQTVVVDAVVESISGGTVTLDPTRFYAGEETDLVTVTEPGGDLGLLLSAVQFEEGERYLVSASDGQVTLCGFSGPHTPSLAAVYDEAFA